jgi:hypothetical protein
LIPSGPSLKIVLIVKEGAAFCKPQICGGVRSAQRAMAWVPARIDRGTSPPIFAVPNVAKWLLAFGMLASPPEITILFLPFTAVYWRD